MLSIRLSQILLSAALLAKAAYSMGMAYPWRSRSLHASFRALAFIMVCMRSMVLVVILIAKILKSGSVMSLYWQIFLTSTSNLLSPLSFIASLNCQQIAWFISMRSGREMCLWMVFCCTNSDIWTSYYHRSRSCLRPLISLTFLLMSSTCYFMFIIYSFLFICLVCTSELALNAL